MAEANPRPLPNDGGDPPNKRKKTTAAGESPPSKNPNESSGSNDAEIEDTATSKKPKKEVIEVVEIDNIHIMQFIIDYRNRNGVYPCNSPDDFQRFCRLYIQKGVGNAEGWSKKMEEMKNKFNNESAPMEDLHKKEFDLWKKIWGNERKSDDDPGVGSSK